MRQILYSVFMVFGLWVAVATPASAQIMMTGSEVLQDCESRGDGARVNRCIGYIAGVIDYHIFQQTLGTPPTVAFCIPENLTREQAAVVVMTYLQKHPEQSAFIGASGVAMAINAVFPCKKKGKR